ncbi:MAG: M23 family metallopeptidase, partial [Acetanaerobacterium sp.]
MHNRTKTTLFITIVILLCAAIAVNGIMIVYHAQARAVSAESGKDYIKWADFDVTTAAMDRAMTLDIDSRDSDTPLDWIELLAYLGAKYGGNFKKYKAKDMDALVKKLQDGQTIDELTSDMKYYAFYREAYDAVLGGMLGSYQIQTSESLEAGTIEYEERYGLKAYSPIAYAYSFSHYDDFGNSRSFGFRRVHLGNDLLGSIGTPVIAVESGVVETMGWNRYGGWRVGIRSFDGRRY